MAIRLLALETSGLVGSIALTEDDRVLRHVTLDSARRTTQTLAPAIQQHLAELAWTPRDLHVIAVTIGPGSFTGLRIGIVTAKVLAYATGAALVGVDTLAVIAAQAPATGEERLDTVLDAQRRQLFVARWRRVPPESWAAGGATVIADQDAWRQQLTPGQLVSGPGLSCLKVPIPENVRIAASDSWLPQAPTVAKLGLSRFESGERDDPWTLTPAYIRPSAAEEKAAG